MNGVTLQLARKLLRQSTIHEAGLSTFDRFRSLPAFFKGYCGLATRGAFPTIEPWRKGPTN